jgi:hypothetical protein
MKLSKVISELQKIADQGDDWKDAEVELEGQVLEGEGSSGGHGAPSSILGFDALDFGSHLLVVLTKE